MTEGIPTDRDVYRQTIRVGSSHIDNLRHVNNVVYVQWMQDVAAAHWNTAAPASLRSQCMWVVLKHEIEYKAQAFEGDELEAHTWIDKPEGPKQLRTVAFVRSGDKKMIVRGVTQWCLLDPATARPKRISTDITDALGLKYG